MQPHIELHIEELVLHGFEGYNQYGIGEAIEREIARLLQERGLPAAFSAGINVDHLNAGTFTVQPNAQANTVGNQIAQSIYKGLGNESTASSESRK